MQVSDRGSAYKLLTNHVAIFVSPEEGILKFSNGSSINADLIIGADGIRSFVRANTGIILDIETSSELLSMHNFGNKAPRVRISEFPPPPPI
jgi:2-polyprenyl-6-methoxyphenol hydroxylase-like FAD-dependent oxidoreductase